MISEKELIKYNKDKDFLKFIDENYTEDEIGKRIDKRVMELTLDEYGLEVKNKSIIELKKIFDKNLSIALIELTEEAIRNYKRGKNNE